MTNDDKLYDLNHTLREMSERLYHDQREHDGWDETVCCIHAALRDACGLGMGEAATYLVREGYSDSLAARVRTLAKRLKEIGDDG